MRKTWLSKVVLKKKHNVYQISDTLGPSTEIEKHSGEEPFLQKINNFVAILSSQSAPEVD